MKYIDITDSLTLDDYYLSDTHFKQDRIDKVVEKLASVMHFSYQNNYEKHEYYLFMVCIMDNQLLEGKPILLHI